MLRHVIYNKEWNVYSLEVSTIDGWLKNEQLVERIIEFVQSQVKQADKIEILIYHQLIRCGYDNGRLWSIW